MSRTRAAAVALVLVASSWFSPAAQAAELPGVSSGPSGNFCVMYLPTGAHTCVASAADLALARAAVLPRGTTPRTTMVAAEPNAVFHIGTVWDNAGYDSSRGSYEFYAGADCTASKLDVNWQNQNLASVGWSNRISSFRSFGNCQTRIFSGSIFTGSVLPLLGFLGATSNVGTAMNDRTQSIRWS